jgi:hypothetical protein
MGGSGSGRWQRGKALTNERMRLDIGRMQADTRVVWSRCFRWNGGASVTVSFRQAVAVVETRLPGNSMYQTDVELDTTPLHFGGHRVWWKCPCCHARVGVLYWQSWRWQCRKCAALVHPSTRETDDSRAFAKVNKVRDALGWGGGLASPMGGRPKGMHWKTYARLMQELADASVAAVGASGVVIERQMQRLEKIRIPK